MHPLLRFATTMTVAAALVGTSVTFGPAPSEAAEARPDVTVIGMGGTIAGKADSRVDFETYQPGRFSVEKLVGDLQPDIGRVADVSTKDFGRKGSGEYTIADYRRLSLLVDSRLREDDAVVVTSGTGSMEELAYFLDRTVRSRKPVVVTGAMRPWNVVSSDGQANLYNAVRLVASGDTHCFGTIVLMNDEIFPARDATKTDATRTDSFGSPEFGRMGTVDQHEIRIGRQPDRYADCEDPGQWRTPFDLSEIEAARLPRVEIVPAYVEAGGEAVRAFADAKVSGLIFAGTPSPAQTEAAMKATKRGMVLVAANEYGSGAIHLERETGVISAGDLTPKKARLLLQLALASSDDPERITEWFANR